MAAKTRSSISPDLRAHLIRVGAAATQRLGTCADSWLDEDLVQIRSELPAQYRDLPLDWLKNQWQNIRKKGTPGFKTSGHGPAVGSRSPRRPGLTAEQEAFLRMGECRKHDKQWLDFWDGCILCRSKDRPVVHRRIVDPAAFGREDFRSRVGFASVIVLCRDCYDRMLEDDDCRRESDGMFDFADDE